MTVKMTSPTEGVVTMRAIVAEGWHLYGMQLPKNGPTPTTFDFAASKGVKFTGPFRPSTEAEEHNDVNFGLKLKWWAGNVSFTRNFRLNGPISEAEIAGSVKFMGCNDANCLPPNTVQFKTKPKPYNPSK